MIDLRRDKIETIEEKLQKKFEPKDIRWRVLEETVYVSDGKTMAKVLPYVNNRAIQKRLDEVFTPFGWQNEFKEWKGTSQLCGISARVINENGEVEKITKWDGAPDTSMESIKGGLSEAMKRASVQWGLGRYLYSVDEIYVEVEQKGREYAIKKEENKKLSNLLLGKPAEENSNDSDSEKPDFVPATENQKTELRKNIDRIPLTLEAVDNNKVSKEEASKILNELWNKGSKSQTSNKKEKAGKKENDESNKTSKIKKAPEIEDKGFPNIDYDSFYMGNDEELEPMGPTKSDKADPYKLKYIRDTQIRGITNKIPDGEKNRRGTVEEVESLIAKAFKIKSLDVATEGMADEIIKYNRSVMAGVIRLGDSPVSA